MAISKTDVLNELNKQNDQFQHGWKTKYIELVTNAAADAGFKLSEMTVRKLRYAHGMTGSNNQLPPIVKATIEIVERLNEERQIQDEQLLESVLPADVLDQFEQFTQAFSNSLKDVRLATAEAINKQNTIAFAQMNQNISQNRTDFNKQLNALEDEKHQLVESLRERDVEITSAAKSIDELKRNVLKLEEQLQLVSQKAKDKEEAEKEVERLKGRLDVYESFPKPTAPTRSQSPKK